MKSILLLMTGIAMGWLLHLFWSQQDGISNEKIGIAISSGSRNMPIEESSSLQVSNSIAVNEIDDRQPESNAIIDSSNDIAQCLTVSGEKATCRRQLLQLVKSSLSTGEAITKLETWLLEYPDDLEVGLLLVDAMVKDRRFLMAIKQLQKIKSYQYEVEAVELLVRKVESLIRSTDRMFHDNGELDSLVSLYEILIEAQASNPRWRFELATVLLKIEKYDRALDMLSYILYDAEYGEKATMLYQEVSRRTDSSVEKNIPLIKNGSQFLVDAVINNTTSLRLLIDTGASITSINKSILARIGARNAQQKKGKLQTVNGTITTTLVNLDSLGIGDFTIYNIEAASIDSLGTDLDGLLGMDFLSRFRFSIDQEARVLFLGDKNAG